MKTTIIISGMHCKSCEMLIKDVLEEEPGVKDVRLGKDRATIEFDVTKTDEDKLKKLIKNEGYGVE